MDLEKTSGNLAVFNPDASLVHPFQFWWVRDACLCVNQLSGSPEDEIPNKY